LKGYRFLLDKADEYTHRYWEDNITRFPWCDVDKIKLKIRSQIERYSDREEYLVLLLSYIDSNADIVPFSTFAQGL